MFERVRQGAVDLVLGASPVNRDTVGDLQAVLESCLQNGQPRIVLNLERVPLLDSRGLQMLCDFQQLCISRGGCVKLAGTSSLCRDILEATGVSAMFEMFDNVLSAAGSFAR